MAVQFDAKGVASIKQDGQELLLDSHLKVRARSTFPPQDDTHAKEPAIKFDAAAKRLLETYPWGSIACTYTVAGDPGLISMSR